MSDGESTWIEVPQLLEPYELADLTEAFDKVGIIHRNRSVSTNVTYWGAAHAYSLWVKSEHVHGAAMILRAYFELNDPAKDTAFSGTCPACGEAVAASWSCSTCELSFRTFQDPDDVLFPFVREHGGFDDP